MSEYITRDNPKIIKLKRVVVKEEFVALTGDITKAIILNQFIYWSERVQDFDKFIAEEQKRCQQDGTEMIMQPTNGWIYKSAEELSDETMLNLSASNIRRHLKYLIDNGWISERTNPVHKWDRTRQYRVNLIKISEDLLQLGYILQDYKVDIGFFDSKTPFSNLENGVCKIENQSSDSENQNSQTRKAIPEITTEITNRDYNPSIHPSADIDNHPLDNKPVDGLMDGISDITKEKPSAHRSCHNQEEDAQVRVLLSQLCKATGATPGQVQEAVRRANRMEKEGKLKGNYLKLVESIARTVVQEDLIKSSNLGDSREINKRASPAPQREKKHDSKKELIRTLYMS